MAEFSDENKVNIWKKNAISVEITVFSRNFTELLTFPMFSAPGQQIHGFPGFPGFPVGVGTLYIDNVTI